MTVSAPESSAPAKLELPPLKLGNLTIDVPVVLAPMAGITNKAFRRLCREYGGGLYVARWSPRGPWWSATEDRCA